MNLLSILTLCLIWVITEGRKQQIQLNITKVVKQKTRTKYLTKFYIGKGQGQFRIRMNKIVKENQNSTRDINLRLGLLKDTKYDQFAELQRCSDRQKLFDKTISLQSGVFLKKDLSFEVIQDQTQDIWYLYIYDCQAPQANYFKQGFQKMKFVIKMLNNGSQLGENQNLFPEYIFLTLLWMIFFVLYIRPITKSIQQTKLWGKMFIYIGFIALILTYIYKIINLTSIYYTGQNIYILYSIAQILRLLIQGILVGVMISIANGWSILNFRTDRMSIFLGIYMAAGNIICSVYDVEDSPDIHHHYDKITFPVILALRAGMLLSLLWGVKRTLNKSTGKIHLFMKKYCLWGSVYLLGWPVGFVLCETFLPKEKHRQFLTLIEQSFHIIGNAMMCHSFSIATSEYKKVDKQNESFMPDA